jgi:nitrogen regulatory protein P-II 1
LSAVAPLAFAIASSDPEEYVWDWISSSAFPPPLTAMKKIEAIIKPFKLEEVKDVLEGMRIHGATVSEVRMQNRLRIHHDTGYGEDFQPRIKLELVVTDEQKCDAVEAILHAAQTGRVGDGKIFVFDISEAIRIRTGEHGAEAV